MMTLQRIRIGAMLLAAACVLSPTVAALGQDAENESTPASEPVDSAHVSECAREFASIKQLYDTIPDDFRGLTRDRLEVIANNVNVCRDRLEAYLINCSRRGAKPECGAYFMLSRLLTSLAARQRITWLQTDKLDPEVVRDKMIEYHRRNVALCDTAIKCASESESKEDAALVCETRDLKADVTFQLRDFDASLENYLHVVNSCSDFEDIGNTVVGAGRAYLELRKVGPGLDFIDKAIKERYKDSSLPFFHEVKWNLLVTKGDIDGMIDWCRTVQRVFPIRMLRETADKVERDAYERYLGFSGFRLGYALFAKGDLSGANDAFAKHIADMDRLEEDRVARKQTLPQELKIYRQRSMDVLNMLQNHVGDAPACDLDLEWVTPSRLRLAESTGKAVVLLFRGYGDTRSKGIFKNLDRHLGNNRDGRGMAAVHFMKGSKDPLGQLEKVQDEVVELQIENIAVGMDPDAKRKATFRCLRAMVGSATLMIYDKYGKLVWWMQDPREMDSAFVAAIWDRLALEKMAQPVGVQKPTPVESGSPKSPGESAGDSDEEKDDAEGE